MKSVLLRVKEGKLDTWKTWCVFLVRHESEILDTLKSENCVRETGILFELEGNYYVYGAMEFLGEPKQADFTVEINRQHRETLRDCLELVSKGEILFDFKIQ